jgi:hypothetical protein
VSGVPGMRRGQGLPDWQLEPCGTPAAYRRHLRRGLRGSQIDESCRQANARAWQDKVAAGYKRPYRGARVHAATLTGRAACGDPRQVAVTDEPGLVTCVKCREGHRRVWRLRVPAGRAA